MLNIAVVEDNDDLRGAVVAALIGEGHHVVGIDSAEALVEQGDLLSIDLMVVDLNLPGEDGLSLARRIRVVQPGIGIIMLTARVATLDRKVGYDSGADIYLTKPVPLEELCAAIQALSRRLRPAVPTGSRILLEVQALLLRGPDGEQHLSMQEAALLAAFARAPDRRLESWQIIEIAERAERVASRNAVNVMIFRLAGKLRRVGAAERPIRAIRNWGYQLSDAVALG